MQVSWAGQLSAWVRGCTSVFGGHLTHTQQCLGVFGATLAALNRSGQGWWCHEWNCSACLLDPSCSFIFFVAWFFTPIMPSFKTGVQKALVS